ncbi:MAG: hypothetical protein OXR68_02875 [Alphaproteobacteria bacterium]|nr:hypothetical protein [Alphaproteobacteria bacterium]MDD9919547.1 hypothetical protein [Alphaproteobacteria bacterium]
MYFLLSLVPAFFVCFVIAGTYLVEFTNISITSFGFFLGFIIVPAVVWIYAIASIILAIRALVKKSKSLLILTALNFLYILALLLARFNSPSPTEHPIQSLFYEYLPFFAWLIFFFASTRNQSDRPIFPSLTKKRRDI